jgi:hypothetical protein
MTILRTVVAFLLVSTVAGAAFVTPSRPAPSSALAFGFLKELGLEKPSWLPDFGGKKEEEEEAAKPKETEEAEEAEAPAPEE